MKKDTAIREIMTTDLLTISPDLNTVKIREIFQENDFHHLPVVDTGERLVGIISKEDLFKLSYVLSLQTTGKTYSEKEYEVLSAREIMTKYPITLDPDDGVGLAADIFLANKFHALPIVEDGQLLGIVTTHDLLQYSFESNIIEKTEEVFEEDF
jgi:acetoin utilization protein AcuB